ncbi:P44/Msp2 family outer membrane protein [Anaplasma phagocytophilum str. Norway variant1]|uniref:P44/Msp2 family outer membrane protein n=1 Tax=Anaplasma phagocytophilum str. Norway variant1 TaxID=1392506 RepID=A0A7H9E1F0_ANAPH|nr:P44/Msp2 family outer membrane protein [Anaplasma phagocytophilum str. Norway variant1]
MRDSGSKEDEADTVYLLAKELAYDVVTGQTDKLAAALAKTSGKDIVQFAKAVGITSPEIDKKVCKTKKHSTGSHYAKYGEATDNDSSGDASKIVAVCGAQAVGSNGNAGGVTAAEVLGDFASKTLGDGSRNWPTSKAVETSNRGNPKPETNDNAEAVAKDLVALNSDEKTIVAGLLAKTIEGGEVVEIRAVSSTSVMVNACYDLLSEGLGVVPYACVGLGGNFVGVVDGIHYTNHL